MKQQGPRHSHASWTGMRDVWGEAHTRNWSQCTLVVIRALACKPVQHASKIFTTVESLAVCEVDFRLLWLFSPFLGVFVRWHVILGIIKVDISSFGRRIVLLLFTFRLPLPLFFASDEAWDLEGWASAVRPFAFAPALVHAWPYLNEKIAGGQVEGILEDYVLLNHSASTCHLCEGVHIDIRLHSCVHQTWERTYGLGCLCSSLA